MFQSLKLLAIMRRYCTWAVPPDVVQCSRMSAQSPAVWPMIWENSGEFGNTIYGRFYVRIPSVRYIWKSLEAVVGRYAISEEGWRLVVNVK